MRGPDSVKKEEWLRLDQALEQVRKEEDFQERMRKTREFLEELFASNSRMREEVQERGILFERMADGKRGIKHHFYLIFPEGMVTLQK